MIPHVITSTQVVIAEFYWNGSWTNLSAAEVQEALDWWNSLRALERILCGPRF